MVNHVIWNLMQLCGDNNTFMHYVNLCVIIVNAALDSIIIVRHLIPQYYYISWSHIV